MIIITGGAGFIGSALVWKLNQSGITDILIVDTLESSEKWRHLVPLEYLEYIHKDVFIKQIKSNALPSTVTALIHLGACSRTTEQNMDFLMDNNTYYSQICAEWAFSKGVRFIYASSAATYGQGEQGFIDHHDTIHSLRPINRYAYSKQLFDKWLLRHGGEKKAAGIKFFNVFGPNEYHKGSMRSMVCKAFEQISETGQVNLFKSHHPDYTDGGQLRDFIYIKDCVSVLFDLIKHPTICGIYNLGTGKAHPWTDLIGAVFKAMDKEVDIEYVDMPKSLRNQYQYFTEADMAKLNNAYRSMGKKLVFMSLENSIEDYVTQYLMQDKAFLS